MIAILITTNTYIQNNFCIFVKNNNMKPLRKLIDIDPTTLRGLKYLASESHMLLKPYIEKRLIDIVKEEMGNKNKKNI